MFRMPKKIIYALPEQIGFTELFVGRAKEFKYFFGDWYHLLEKNFAQNQALISRRKKGKTAFLQRLFNILWSAGLERKRGELAVIPFYFSIADHEVSLADFSKSFFTQFVNHYYAYRTQNPEYVRVPLSFDEIGDNVEDDLILRLYKRIQTEESNSSWNGMWHVASQAPSTVGRATGEKVVQIIDEFQNINEYIYDKDKEKLKRLSGTYMQVAEFREAPLIVSGSEVHWLLKIVRSLTGRFQTYPLENLPKEEAEEAIKRYAAVMNTKVDDEAKEKIWELTRGDPLYIKALFLSRFNEAKDYTVDENIIDVYEKEIRSGEIYTTWMEYMLNTFDSVNKVNSKRIMLYLFKQGKERTRGEIIKDLKLPYTDLEAEEKLNALIAGDLVSQGTSAYDYKITNDKTYELVFRYVYQKEIEHFVPDIGADIKRMLGKANYTKGKFTEFLLKERMKKPFNLKDLTENGEDRMINPVEIEERKVIQTGVGKNEIDLYILDENGYEVYVDVKNTAKRYGKRQAERWLRIVDYLRKKSEKALFLVYSENEFTKGTKELLEAQKVCVVEK